MSRYSPFVKLSGLIVVASSMALLFCMIPPEKTKTTVTMKKVIPARYHSAGQKKMPFLMGVNLAGAEFGEAIMPGVHGTDYLYPLPKDIVRYQKFGFNIIRLPFRWERLQPDLFSDFRENEWQRIENLIEAAEKTGCYLVLDLHNYARRKLRKDGFKKDYRIGSASLPTRAFTAFWQEIARRTKQYPGVIYGMMNEPHDMPARDWLAIAQKTIDAIRQENAKNLVLVPGTAWSGAHSWVADSGNIIMAKLKDPLNNIALEVHQYLDWDSSGTNPQAVSRTIGKERLQTFQKWAREHHFKAFLGEFGSGADPVSLAALSTMLEEVSQNRDVWLGWTAWAAGPWWPEDDKFALEPTSKGLPRQTRLLVQIAEKERQKHKEQK